MNKVYTSAVVIIPPHDKWGSIQEIRKMHDRNLNRWMPHITLLYPFRPESEYPTIKKDFAEICKSISPFEINLPDFHYFNHGHQWYTLWLRPEPVDLIKNLQARIVKIVPDCNDTSKYKKGFNPHLSVGQINGKNKLLGIIKDLQSNWNEVKFQLTEIFFIARDKSKTSKFEIKKRIQLKKE